MGSQHDRRNPILAWALGSSALAYFFFLRPQLRKWGTRLGEALRRLPGDEIIPKASVDMTFAIDIDAPPEAVWPWLAQMGRDRTGFYAADTPLNRGIPSVTYLRQDVSAPEVNAPMDAGLHVMAVEPNRELLFGAYELAWVPGIAQDVTALYLLERHADGSTRLLVRHRAFTYGALAPLFNLAYELLVFAFSQQQLAQLKQHALSMAHVRQPM